VRLVLPAVAFAAAAAAQSASDLALRIREAGLDPEACYRVREVHFSRGDDVRFYFTEGFLIFGKPVGGRRISAVFSSATDGGDAELLVMPPTRGERVSLASFTESPNLNEHFSDGLFLFTDDSAETLLAAIERAGEVRKAPERGVLLASEWHTVLANITRSFSVRLVQHLAGDWPRDRGFFYGALRGRKLGNFDVFHDPAAPDQIYLGQLKYKDDRPFYDTWTAFPSRPFRSGARQPLPPDLILSNYRIEAVLEPNLHLRVVTRATAKPSRPLRVLAFEISEGMKITAVRVNGDPAEVFTHDSFRANLIRRLGSILFLVFPRQPVEPGRAYEVEFEHEGDVVRPAGRNVYYVGSRGNWHPRAGLDFALFDITFTYPENMDLVFPGDVKEERTEDNVRVTRRVTPVPVRLAGFNLGQYERHKSVRGNLTVHVYANRQAEPGIHRRTADLIPIPSPPSPFPPRGAAGRRPAPDILAIPAPPPNPAARLEQLSGEVADAFVFLAGHFGPPALNTLHVSPIPGAFGQGFPGLVYLSTLSYLNPSDRPSAAHSSQQQLFFSEILHAHETAHQWWGNVVAADTAQDEWLMEALANYSALLVLEKKKGTRAMLSVLDQYRRQLFVQDGDGREMDAAGPIRLGPRLTSSQSPEAWRHIVYGKGSWIIHMLRRRLGDAAFYPLLAGFARRYRFQHASVRQFQEAVAEVAPKDFVEPFFEHWVENTGIPAFTLTHQFKAGRLTITVTQAEAGEKASFQVPVEVLATPRGKSQIHWIATGNEPATLTLAMRTPPAKVTLDPDWAVLRR